MSRRKRARRAPYAIWSLLAKIVVNGVPASRSFCVETVTNSWSAM
jgi:hypothetical protein